MEQLVLPPNVRVGEESVLTGAHSFRPFKSELEDALVIGSHCTMEAVHFALGRSARVRVGDYCYFTNAMLLAEQEIVIGNYVVLGWNVAVADTDFHPIGPAERIADIVALSPIGAGRPRPPLLKLSVIIEDDVWVGPNSTILKGVRVGSGSFIEPGSLLTRDVPPRSRVMGNPARVIGAL